MSFVQLLNEITSQLTGEQLEMKRKVELLDKFSRLLFETADQNKKVVIIIDEANVMSGSNLESLRLLTNMQTDDQNLFTLVLAGQTELARKLEHPRRANLFQRIGAYCQIEKIESVEVLNDYIATRLRLAGGRKMMFTDDAIREVWEASDYGVPRLVNKVCKLSMKAGETNGFHAIDKSIVQQVSNRFRKLSTVKLTKNTPPTSKETECSIHKLPTSRPPQPRPAESGRTSALEANKTMMPNTRVRDIESKQSSGPAETNVDAFAIKVTIPDDILQQAHSYTDATRARVAGMLAAQTLQKYPELAFSRSRDPVSIWSDIRTSIIDILEQQARAVAQ